MDSNKMKSRKFWLALIGAILPIAAAAMTEEMPINEAMMESIAVICAYIFGQGYVDAAAKAAEKKAAAEVEG